MSRQKVACRRRGRGIARTCGRGGQGPAEAATSVLCNEVVVGASCQSGSRRNCVSCIDRKCNVENRSPRYAVYCRRKFWRDRMIEPLWYKLQVVKGDIGMDHHSRVY